MGLKVSDEVFKRYGRAYKPGEVIFREGDAGETMFIIQEGEVRIHKRVRDKETTLAVLKDGDFFGEMAIIDKEPRSASAPPKRNPGLSSYPTRYSKAKSRRTRR